MSAHNFTTLTPSHKATLEDLRVIEQLIETSVQLSQTTHGFSRVQPQAQKALATLRSLSSRPLTAQELKSGTITPNAT